MHSLILDDSSLVLKSLGILTHALRHTGNPAELGTYLAGEIQDLTRAQCVLLIHCPDNGSSATYRLLGIHPSSLGSIRAESAAIVRLGEIVPHLTAAEIWRAEETTEGAGLLHSLGFDLSMVIPLRVNSTHVGALLLLGLPQDLPLPNLLDRLTLLANGLTPLLHRAFLNEAEQQIAERRKRELQNGKEMLAEAQERLDMALQSSHIGLWDWDIQRNRLTWNDHIHPLVGFKPWALTRNMEEFLVIVHPEDREGVQFALAKAIEEDNVYHAEYRIVGPVDNPRYHVAHGKVYRDQVGQAARVVGVFWDVTESKEAEESLRKAHQQLNATLDALPDFMFEVDREGRIYDYRAHDPQMLYTSPQNFLGKKIAELLPEAAAAIIMEALLQASRQGHHRGAIYTLEMPGGLKWFELSVASKGDIQAANNRFIALVRDVTFRKQAEEALRQSESLHRLLAENVLDVISRHSPDGQILYVTPSIETLLGYRAEELIGQGVEKSSPPDVVEAAWKAIHSALDCKDNQYRVEHRMIRKDGGEIWVETRGHLITDEQGKLKEIHCLVRDCTDRRRTQEELARHGEQLEQLIRERTLELEAKNRQLSVEIFERQKKEEALEQMVERFNLATHAAGLGVWDLDVAKDQLVWDERMYKLYGVKKEDFPGVYQAWADCVHPDDIPRSQEEVQMALRGEKDYDTEFRVIWPDGTVRHIKTYAQVVRDADKRPLRMTGINYDITERKQIDEELRRYREELEVLVQNRTAELEEKNMQLQLEIAERKRVEAELRQREEKYHALFETACDAIIVIEQSSTQILEANPAACRLYGYTLDELKQRTAMDLTTEPQKSLNLIQTGVHVVPLRYHRKKDGTIFPVELMGSVFQQAERSLCVGMIRDITERRRAEEELHRLYEQTQRDAQAKSNLLNEVNHRVKNNLMAILGLLLVEQQYSPVEGRHFVEKVLGDLANRIEGLLKVHERLSESQWAPMGLTDLAGFILRFAIHAIHPTCRVETDIQPSDIEVSSRQANNLALVFNELATNTIKHAAEGRDAVHIEVRLWREKDVICIEYSDNGPGYPEDVLQRQRTNVGISLVRQLITGTLGGKLILANRAGAITLMHIKTEDRFPSNQGREPLLEKKSDSESIPISVPNPREESGR